MALQACRGIVRREGRRQSSRRGWGRTETMTHERRRTARLRAEDVEAMDDGGAEARSRSKEGGWRQRRCFPASLVLCFAERQRRERDGWELGRIREVEAASKGGRAGLVVWIRLGLGT
ncbi:unnamed protein product [Linum trigynum]|uniref:Uncharacterized protein n=1 Tax=Linum trigynum TaxID=586398 RepID=A0AAV2FP27_9ROSI